MNQTDIGRSTSWRHTWAVFKPRLLGFGCYSWRTPFWNCAIWPKSIVCPRKSPIACCRSNLPPISVLFVLPEPSPVARSPRELKIMLAALILFTRETALHRNQEHVACRDAWKQNLRLSVLHVSSGLECSSLSLETRFLSRQTPKPLASVKNNSSYSRHSCFPTHQTKQSPGKS